MNKYLLSFILTITTSLIAFSQTGTEFWFAAPEVTNAHGDRPVVIRVSTGDQAATVTIDMPAEGGFTPRVINVPANSSHTEDVTADIDLIETKPENTILNSGLLITATAPITAYYEVNRTNNPDIFALKGASGLGTEFYTPFQILFNNNTDRNWNPAPYASFDIVATEDNTTIRIYPRKDLVGRPAFAQFTVTLNRGQTFSSRSASVLGIEKPSGSVILSDKPIAVTIKDDSNDKNTAGEGCKDLLGDQIIPTDIIGREYIVSRGQLTTEESFFVLATENNTKISINGTEDATLFAGETMTYPVTNPHTFVQADKPVYLIHVSGFGCEMGMAVLPPLNCAGSEQVFFTRSTTEYFGLNVLVKTGAEDAFELNGSTTLIQATDFVDVPGTAGQWKATQLSFNTTDIPLNVSNLITNSKDVFGLGIIHGGATSGCRFGYFSEFKAPILVDAGSNFFTCNGNDVPLTGIVSGGVNSGLWTTNGSGTFDDDTDLNTTYRPTTSDYALGNLKFGLASTGICPPKYDTIDLNFTVAPTVDAGIDQSICDNNTLVSLTGDVQIAPGGQWSGGAGTFLPNNTDLNATYQPTQTEIDAGSIRIYLENLLHQDCQTVTDSLDLTFTNSPVVSAGVNLFTCENNPDANLNGQVTASNGNNAGEWVNFGGFVTPANTALTGVYTPSPVEISAGSATLTLRSNEGDNCNYETDDIMITIEASPIVNAGSDQSICINNPDIQLNGSVTQAAGGTWIGGLGSFSPDRNTLNAIYTPAQSELSFGSVTLRLQTDNPVANCLDVEDEITITFTPSPTVDAGLTQSVCENNATLTLNGDVQVAPGGTWSGGLGLFSPSATALGATYTPVQSELDAGSIYLYLTTLSHLNCSDERDSVLLTFTSAPIVEAGNPISTCENNPDANLNGQVTASNGNNAGEWVNFGGFVTPANTALTGIYTPSPVEISSGTATLTLRSNEGDNCNYVQDDVTITIEESPVVNAGSDQSVCINNSIIQLNGSVSQAAGGTWIGGLGSFSPNRNTLNATYTPSQSELSFGSVTLRLQTDSPISNCLDVEDDVTFTFTPSPTVDAGIDQAICDNNSTVTLNGDVQTAPGGTWSGGNGIFSPSATALGATYTPTQPEIDGGSLYLYLTTLSHLNCIDEKDSLLITFTPAPIVNAGNPISTCVNNPDANLNGQITASNGVNAGEWINLGGFVTPANTSLTGVYTPSPVEIASGTATITLRSNEGDNCNYVQDDLAITIEDSPVVNAGNDESICINNPNIQLNGSVTQAAGGVWQGGLGTFVPNRSTLNAVYQPAQSEISFGSITLRLITDTPVATCLDVEDDVTYTFTPAPIVDAGIDQTICANNNTLTLDGTVFTAPGGTWTGGNGSFNNGVTALNGTYTPTQTEIDNGSLYLTLTSLDHENCTAEKDSFLISFTAAPIVNAGSTVESCENNPNATLDGSVIASSGAGSGEWINGNGVFTPSEFALKAIYTPTPTEISNGSVNLTLQSNDGDNCNYESDIMEITIAPSPTANAGSDQVICTNNAEIQLNGSVTQANGGTWVGGLGTFSPDRNTLNAIYTPSAGELSLSGVILTLRTTGLQSNCVAVEDQMEITFTTAPTVDAGPDQNVCGNNADVQLAAISTLAPGITWSGFNGSFVTGNENTPNSVYRPSTGEVNAGEAKLYITTLPYLNCNTVTDSISITITPAPTVDAGPNVSSCANNASADLRGSFTNASGITWSGSGGSFVPSINAIEVTYIPTSTEISNGSTKLYISTFDLVNNCNVENDSLTLTINAAPSVSAGTDQSICANNSNISLSGTVTLAAGGRWSGGLGSFIPHDSASNVTYIPTTTEINSGNLTMTFTSRGNGTCNPEADQMNIAFTAAPTISAGLDQSVCSNNTNTNLDGGFSVASGVVWTGGTGQFTPNVFDPKAIYQPSQTEIDNGSITLTLQSTGNGNCNAVNDQMDITFTPSPFADAGEDVYICVTDLNAPLNGFVSGATTTGRWTTDGTGTFFPNSNSLNATYIATSQDSANGSVGLTLTTTNSGNCLEVSSQTNVFITTPGVADAGIDQSVCGNNAIIDLNGTVTGGASSGQWTSTGSGYFTPNENSLIASYIASDQDTANGSVTITLTANSCDRASDDVLITITDAPYTDAGVDQTLCKSSPNAQLAGSVTGITTTGSWSTTGTGSFSPNANTLNAIYQPSATDLSKGGVLIYLTPTNIGNCLIIRDTLALTYKELGSVSIGGDISLCANSSDAQLSATLTGGATGGIWTSTGTGTFSPSPNLTDVTYLPSLLDLGNGNVTLTFTTNSCDDAADDLLLSFSPPPQVNAGLDKTVCSNNAETPLLGSYVLAGGAIWSTSGSGDFSPNISTMNAVYIPSEDDKDDGGVTIYLTTTGNGNCSAETDSMKLTITPKAIVNAGKDQSICSFNLESQLAGQITFGSGKGKWNTSGSGTFMPNDSSLTARYLLSTADSVNGAVELTLTSTDNGICFAENDKMVITLGGSAFVDAGSDQLLCSENLVASLSGIISGGATSGTWSSSGDGYFLPNKTSLNVSYTYGSQDSLTGLVDITLKSDLVEGCSSSSDNIQLSIAPITRVNAGEDQVVCEKVDNVFLSGELENGNIGQWKSLGNGYFSPNDQVFTPTYFFGPADIADKKVDIVFSSFGNYGCEEKTDTITITLDNPVSAGFEFSPACEKTEIVFTDTSIIASGSTDTTWTWISSDGQNSNVQDAIFLFEETGFYDIKLVVTEASGCKDSTTQTVEVFPLPIAKFSYTPEFPTLLDDVTFLDESTNSDKYLWTFGNGDSSEIAEPIYVYSNPGVYDVTQRVMSTDGCQDSVSVLLDVLNKEVVPPKLPTAFTPNGDGKNDKFIVRGGPFSTIDFKVYNQWGELIFETTDPNGGWDGYYKGKKQPLGVYLYTVKAKTIEGLDFEKTGEINLID